MYYLFFTDVLFSIGTASKENEATSKNNIGEGSTHARMHTHAKVTVAKTVLIINYWLPHARVDHNEIRFETESRTNLQSK